LLPALTLASGLLCADSALAFSDPVAFGVSTILAGGDGRYFTGSPADGYTCKACHSGGDEVKATVLGLPLAGYKPAARYEITIKWPTNAKHVALSLELTDGGGAGAGTLRLPPDAEVQTAEKCDEENGSMLAAQLAELTSGRQVINVLDCGSKSARFLWTAPSTDIGPIWFSGSLVSSDHEGDPYHDGVTDFGRIVGSPATASTTTAQCSLAGSAVRASESGGPAWLWGFGSGGLAVAFWFRRRQRR
jgi:hypothetical protein